MIKDSDKYIWMVAYDDGAQAESSANRFADVDQSRVKSLRLVSRSSAGASHRVDIPSEAQAIFFRRRSLEVQLLSGEEQVRPTVHCIGWKREESAVYLFVFDDGSTLLTNDLQAV